MRINTHYKLREIAGETIVVNQGTANVNMTRIISLNSTACLLYRKLSEKDFTIEDAANILIETYRIDKDQAMADATSWAVSLKNCGIID